LTREAIGRESASNAPDYILDRGRRTDLEWAVCNCIAFGSKNSALVVRKLRRGQLSA